MCRSLWGVPSWEFPRTFSALSMASWMMDLRVRLSAGFSVRSGSLRLQPFQLLKGCALSACCAYEPWPCFQACCRPLLRMLPVFRMYSGEEREEQSRTGGCMGPAAPRAVRAPDGVVVHGRDVG